MPSQDLRPPVLAIVGATATGKSALALELAEEFEAEIVSIDSVQVYREMDIGSDKPSAIERDRVQHHLIDIVDPSDEIDAFTFRIHAIRAIEQIREKGRTPLLVGGSALYFTSVTAPLSFRATDPTIRDEIESRLERYGLAAIVDELTHIDPASAASIDLANPRRVVRALEHAEISIRSAGDAECDSTAPLAAPGGKSSRPGAGPASLTERADIDYPIRLIGIGLTTSIENHSHRIRARVDKMLDRGFEREVRDLFGLDGQEGRSVARHKELSRTARQALGYKELAAAIAEGHSSDSAIDKIVARTRQLSRRQLAWFRKDARISWFSTSRCSRKDLTSAARHYFASRIGATQRGSCG